MKKICFLIVTALVFISFSHSKNLNFQVIQNNPGQEDVFQMSLVFEQALADFFFESGHIVSNSPVYITKGDSQADKAELKRALVETLLGSMDVLIRLEVSFIPEKANSPEVYVLESIKNVKWSNYNAKNGQLISTGEASPGTVDPQDNSESGVYNFASLVASKISSTLKKGI